MHKTDRGCIDFVKCAGCPSITTFPLDNGAQVRGCSRYLWPSYWWRRGACPFRLPAPIASATTAKVRIGRQKSRKKKG